MATQRSRRRRHSARIRSNCCKRVSMRIRTIVVAVLKVQRSRTCRDSFASALSAEHEFGWEDAVSEWLEMNGAGPGAFPSSTQKQDDRFFEWAVLTVNAAVKDRKVSIAALCKAWAVPLPERANSVERDEQAAAKARKLRKR